MARGVHLFDLLRFLTGEEVRTVTSTSDATTSSVDRTFEATLTLSKGTTAHVFTSKNLPGADNHVTLYGTKGTLRITDFWTERSLLSFSSARKHYTKTYRSENLTKLLLEEFAQGCAGKRTTLATNEDALKTVAVTVASTASARTGHKVTVATA